MLRCKKERVAHSQTILKCLYFEAMRFISTLTSLAKASQNKFSLQGKFCWILLKLIRIHLKFHFPKNFVSQWDTHSNTLECPNRSPTYGENSILCYFAPDLWIALTPCMCTALAAMQSRGSWCYWKTWCLAELWKFHWTQKISKGKQWLLGNSKIFDRLVCENVCDTLEDNVHEPHRKVSVGLVRA